MEKYETIFAAAYRFKINGYMKIWYSCKVKFSKETEDGFLKQVTENSQT